MGADHLIAGDFVPAGRAAELHRVAEKFAVAITEDMAALIDPTDPGDPIAAQFVPNVAELESAPDDQPDPIGDERWSPLPGIVHRYPDRVLLKPILVCPVYCRFCFRREQVGQGMGSSRRPLSITPLPISKSIPRSGRSLSPVATRSSCRRDALRRWSAASNGFRMSR